MTEPATQKKILVIDDDPDIRSLINVLFEEEGHDVEEASNGLEGAKIVGEFMPDLIILDVNMPIANGFKVCKILKANQVVRPRTDDVTGAETVTG